MARTFRLQKPEEYDPAQAEQTLTKEPVAVYYRQSSFSQVGNISTSIQTIDMPEELVRRGWKREHIILIDADEGVSGTKRIDEREGMSQLLELIAERKIGAVACQDEDRLFRDLTQIQVNIFIDVCRKSRVKVITPYFTYDFAHPLQGEFHARQFRFKCDMAAEYLKSYVLGRLASARQRLLREGRWAGAPIAIGYMVDDRKQLPDGDENPNWRKFVPLEPMAEVVRHYFRIFLEAGGVTRKAMKRIRKEGISFPVSPPPEGFKAKYQLKNRGDGRFMSRSCFINLLTNPVYIGHWCYQGVVIRWNNHQPIIDHETFMRVFNILSRYSLTGAKNQNHQPAYQWVRPELDEVRNVERPLLLGLIRSQINGSWYKTSCIYEKRHKHYLYQQPEVEAEGVKSAWVRQANWIDEAVVGCFRTKLQATFNSDLWQEAIKDEEQTSARERKVRQLQLSSLEDEMQNLVVSLKTLSHPYLIQEVESRFKQMEHERDRLVSQLATLDNRQQHHLKSEQAIAIAQKAFADWDNLLPDEQRNVLRLFIDHVEAWDYDRSGNMRLVIFWKDKTTDEIRLWHKSHSELWNRENTLRLLKLIDAGASQLEIGQAFPTVKWFQIFNEIKRHRGLFRISPVYFGKSTTYEEYVARGGGKGKATCSRWQPFEIDELKIMVERDATQIEIMQRFPYRRWIQIQARLAMIYGRGLRVKRAYASPTQDMTFFDYLEQADEKLPKISADIKTTQNCEASSGTEAHCFLLRCGLVPGFPLRRYQEGRQLQNWEFERVG